MYVDKSKISFDLVEINSFNAIINQFQTLSIETHLLNRIFPGHNGSYTQAGPGLSHSEVIIWDADLNDDLHSTKSYDYKKLEPTKRKRSNNNNNSQSKTSKKDQYNSPLGLPHTPSGGGKKKKTKKLKSKKSKKRKNNKRSHKHKK